jgi:hypothetical protein
MTRLRGVLERACLPHDHPIRLVLEREAEIEGVREVSVRCRGESLDQRIDDLRRDPSYACTFPQATAKVAKNDLRELSKNFGGIASGSIRVE